MKVWGLIIKESVLNKLGKPSSARIASYFMLIPIMLHSICYVAIEMGNAIACWLDPSKGKYEIPFAHITIFALILSHHLVLLGLKNASDKANNSIPIFANPTTNQPTNTHTTDNTEVVDKCTPDNPDIEESVD